MKDLKFKLGIALLGFILLVPSIYICSVLYIKNVGIELKTDKTFDYSQDLEYFLQTDPRWNDDVLGDSVYTLAQQGCTVTDVAMVLNYLGHETDPGTLNEEFTQNGLYTENGNLLWFMIEEIYPVEYEYKRVFWSGTIENDLEDGVLPILRVKYGDSGVEHWILIVGADGSDFLVMDPLNENKTVTSLGEYGKVYAYRAINPKGS